MSTTARDHETICHDEKSIADWLTHFFATAEHGKPDAISKQGCLELSKHGPIVWNFWRNQYPVKSYAPFVHENRADFSNTDFEKNHIGCGRGRITFSDFDFGAGANFSKSKFPRHTSFDNAILGEHSDFSETSFDARSTFIGTTFMSYINFENARFEDWISFDFAIFTGSISFANSHFGTAVRFNGAGFGPDISFARCEFRQGACFETLSPSNQSISKWSPYEPYHDSFNSISFNDCIFHGLVIFKNRIFRDATSFDRAVFKKPPDFLGCTLQQHVSFEAAEFPLPGSESFAVSKYRVLRNAFTQLQASHEEQKFFQLEMAEITAATKGHKKFLLRVYGILSNYGTSITKPFGGLALIFILASASYAALSWLNYCFPATSQCEFSSKWLEFSLLQTLPLPGIEKMAESVWPIDKDASVTLRLFITLTIITQKIASLLFFFLIGLALRNFFRLK